MAKKKVVKTAPIIEQFIDLANTQRELAERMGVHQNMPAKWSSGDEPSQMAVKFMELLIEHEKVKCRLDKFQQAFVLIDEAKK